MNIAIMDESFGEQIFLTNLLKSLTSKPDDVKIIRTVDSLGVLYTVSIAKEDVGKIIGKNGDTAKAIRCLLRIVAHDNNVRATMKIDAPTAESNNSK